MLPTSSRQTTSTTRGDDGLRARPGHLAGGGGSGPADPARPGPHRDRRRGLRRLPTMRAADRLAAPTRPARDHTLHALRRVALTAQDNGRPRANVRRASNQPRAIYRRRLAARLSPRVLRAVDAAAPHPRLGAP